MGYRTYPDGHMSDQVEDVERALVSQGFRVVKRDMTATNFYFSRILEAVRV